MKTYLIKFIKTESDYVYILVAVLLTAFICITPNSDLFFYDGKRVAEISLVLLTFILLSASATVQNLFIKSILPGNPAILVTLLILFLLGCASAFLSPAPQRAFIEIISLFSLLLVSLQCAQTWRLFPKIIPWVISALLLSFAIQELRFFSYYAAFLLTKSSFSFYDFFFTFAHPRFFNQYQLWTLPLLTLVLLVDHPALKNPRLRFSLWSLAIVWWGMCFTTNGRGAIVAVIASFIITLLIFRKQAWSFLKITLLLMLLGAAFYQILFHLIPFLITDETVHSVKNNAQTFAIRMTSSGRTTALWPTAIQFITENPWLGIGPMHYSAWNGEEILAHPHNSLLQIAAEWGLPSLAIFVFLLYRVFHGWCRRFNVHSLKDQQNNLNLAIIAITFSLCSAFIYSLFGGVFIMPMSHLTGMLVCSFAIAIYQENAPLTEQKTTRHHWLLTLIFAIFAISYFWLLSPELIPRLVDNTFMSKIEIDVSGPRFWLNH